MAWVSQEDLDAGDAPDGLPHPRARAGLPIMLEGSGCVVWLALADGGTLDEITAAAAAMAERRVERRSATTSRRWSTSSSVIGVVRED